LSHLRRERNEDGKNSQGIEGHKKRNKRQKDLQRKSIALELTSTEASHENNLLINLEKQLLSFRIQSGTANCFNTLFPLGTPMLLKKIASCLLLTP
jgi:hypothetical protein